MTFIGVFEENKKFTILKNIMQRNMGNNITLININEKNVQNLKNIKFDVVVIMDPLEEFTENINYIKEIFKGAKCFIINSDIKLKIDALSNIESTIISFGLNHKSTVTFSSITDEKILISVQRNFENKSGKMLDVGEYDFAINSQERIYLYEIIVAFILEKLYI